MEEQEKIIKIKKTLNIKEYMKNYLKVYNKKYYQKNKEKILQKYNKKCLCEICNIETSLYNLHHHINTMKHKRNLEIFELQLKLNAKTTL